MVNPKIRSADLATQTGSALRPESSRDSLVYPLSDVPAPARLVEVAPGVHWLRMPLPFALDHINLWLLRDGDGWTIVDCGYATEMVKNLWERIFLAYLDGRPVNRVIVTHYHPDHLGLGAWLVNRFGVDLWIAQAEFLTAHLAWAGSAGFESACLIDLFRQHGLEEEHLAALRAHGIRYRTGVPELPSKFRRIIDRETIEIGGNEWRVIAGYGHAPEHCALFCDTLGALISGDMVLPRISTNVSVWAMEPQGDPLRLFLESLQRYRELPADTLVLPSHGKVFRGLHTRITQLELHHEHQLYALSAACEEPRCAAELLPVLFDRVLDTHQRFFAMGEAVAHLNYLTHRQQFERITGWDGVYRFVRRRSDMAADYPDVL